MLAVAERVTVMRQGRVTGGADGRRPTSGLARLMVGRDVILRIDKMPPTPGEVVLQLQQVNAVDDRRLPALRDVNLSVRAGTVLGVAGVEGNGQTVYPEVITGLRPPTGWPHPAERQRTSRAAHRGSCARRASPTSRRTGWSAA